MEFDEEQDNCVSGNIPLFGAIFMSNRDTKEECFRRKLFGLPASQSNFVKKIKAGMALFLFEYEKRKLYGVFQASSDGAINIVPHAYSSSGKQFSAQIRFMKIWDCNPLSEHDFCDAIKDNYYTSQKFHFGLSKDQVHKLLRLFNSRKIKIQRFQSPMTGSKVIKQYENSGLGVGATERGRFITTDRLENDNNKDNCIDPLELMRYHGLSRSNLNPSGYYDKNILETDDSIVEVRRGIPLTVPQSAESQKSNLYFSTSPVDAIRKSNLPVNAVFSPYNPEAPNFEFGYPLSFETDYNSTILQKFAAYSKNEADCLSPFSRNPLTSSHVDSGNLDMSISRHQIPNVTSDLGEDFIPLSDSDPYESPSTNIPFSGLGYIENKIIEPSSLEGYKSSSFYEPSMMTSLYSSNGKIPEDWNYKPFTSTVPLSYANHNQLQEGVYPSERQRMDYYKHDPIYDGGGDDQMFTGLRSVTHKKRTSVFNRLTEAPEGIQELNDYAAYSNSMDTSIDQIMEQLQWSQKSQIRVMRRSKPFSKRHDDDEKHFEDATQIWMSGVGTTVDQEETLNSDTVTEEIPLLNFKRRSEMRKLLGENEARGCIEGAETEGGSGKQHKRRKLVRPVFGKEFSYDKDIISDSCLTMQPSSQGNAVSGKAPIRNDDFDGFENRSSEKLDIPPYVNSCAGCASDNGKMEHGSITVSKVEESKKLVGTSDVQQSSQNKYEDKVESCETLVKNGGGEDNERLLVQNLSNKDLLEGLSKEHVGISGNCSIMRQSSQEICEGKGNTEGGEALVRIDCIKGNE